MPNLSPGKKLTAVQSISERITQISVDGFYANVDKVAEVFCSPEISAKMRKEIVAECEKRGIDLLTALQRRWDKWDEITELLTSAKPVEISCRPFRVPMQIVRKP